MKPQLVRKEAVGNVEEIADPAAARFISFQQEIFSVLKNHDFLTIFLALVLGDPEVHVLGAG